LIGRILAARGFSESLQVDRLLFPKLTELKDPLSLLGMEKAVGRLVEAALKKEKICIYADFDLDGTSGLALLKTGMLALGFTDVIHYQPKRLSEGYGFHAAVVEELHRQGVSLIITVDVGITANPAVEKAVALGIDVILTDHHLPGAILPPAFVVVNPNQSADQSGLGYLCGAGVAFYLLRALKRVFTDHPQLPKNEFELKDVLDFFTIATLTDMVPLVDDNRVLVKHGLIKLAETQRPGLRALLKELDLENRALTSQDVAIRFAPKLNALSRMENGILPIDLFLVDDEKIATQMVKQVMKNNSTRVQLQSDAETEALSLLKAWPHGDFVFVMSPNFHRGIVGLIATKLSQVFNRPAFVGAQGTDGVIVGSARLPQGQEACLVEAMGSAKNYLTRFGGHSAAAGFELHGDQVPHLVDALNIHFQGLRERPKPLEIFYDVQARLGDVGAPLMKWYDFVGPFGAGFSIPLIHFSKVLLHSKRSLKGGHWRLKLVEPDGGGSHEALLFSPSPRHLQVLEKPHEFLDVLGELQWNYFGGQKTVQILVRDLKPSGEVGDT
jgi:single-stranded-DNA-specific exonuclease